MARSVWKLAFFDNELHKKLERLGSDGELLGSRNSTITPRLIGKRLSVHNGKSYRKILIDEDKVGLKLGEFVFTKKRAVYKKNKKSKR